ncbi:MAG: glycosyltransferase involved in cell wall biosynthesis [Psychroserpens sp.]|jgi:glycosyltransferase involved in cell wall biosynthesis
MKIFTFFIEPATYSLDLKKNIYHDLGIDSVFIKKNRSIAKSSEEDDYEALEGNSLFFKLRFIVNVFKSYDFIIINGYTSFVFIFLFLLNKISKNKVCLAIESDTPLSQPKNKFKKKLKTIFLNYIFKPCWVLGFAGGNASHKELFRHYGMAEKKIYFMPMMVDNSKYYPIKTDNTSHKFTFLFVGRVVPNKNIEELLIAFSKWNKNNKGCLLKVIGDGELLAKFKENYKSDSIAFTGAKNSNDLYVEYQDADVFILPSLHEPWGLVVNEAMCSGLPVIVSNKVGAAYDLVEGKDTGFIFEVGNVEALIKKLDIMYHNKVLRNKFSFNALELMKSNWNYELYKKCLLKALQYKAN